MFRVQDLSRPNFMLLQAASDLSDDGAGFADGTF
jgi:hypothetical protein